MSQESAAPQRSRFFAWGTLSVVCLVVAFAALGSYSTLGTHEVIGVVPAREMLQSGDWVVPRYGEIPRTRKPPLLYWLVASSSWLFGEISEFSARFHSAVAFLGLTAIVGLWAGRWYGREAAFGAALIQITSYWTIHYGRHVEIDMVMCLLTTTAMFLIATQPEDESPSRSRRRWLGILTLVGLTWLAKFHYGTAMIFGPVFVLWVIERRWRKFGNLIHPLGLLIVVACAVIWPYLLIRQYPEALTRIEFETVGRATGQISRDPWWYYGSKLLLLSLPWTGHFVWGAVSSWRQAWLHGDSRERFLWAWLLVDVLIVSLSPNKHMNYLLAAMPAMTLIASQTVARGFARIHRGSLRVPQLAPHLVGVAAASVFIAAGVLIPFDSPAVAAGLRITAGIGLCGVILSWWLWQTRRWSAAGWTILAVGIVGFVIVTSQVTPELDSRKITAEFAAHVRQHFLKDRPVCVYVRRGTLPGFHPSIFYLDAPVYQVSTLSELLHEVKQSGELLAVVEQQNLLRLQAVAPFVELEELARMTQMAGSREQPLVCVRLRDRRDIEGKTTTASKEPADAVDSAKRR